MWYTVTRVEEKKRWNNKFGDFITYDVALMGEDGMECASCQLNQKDTTPAPLVDERIHGYIEDSDFGFKFKKTQPEDGSPAVQHPRSTGASQPSTSGGGNDTQNQIIRQSSLKVAADLCIANKKANKDIEPQTVLVLAEMLAQYAQTGRMGQAASESSNEVDEAMKAFDEYKEVV